MNKIVLASALGLAALVSSMSAQAVDVTGNFNVNITLTANCAITTAATDINLTYTSFQTAASTGSTNFNVRCTTGLPYTVKLDGTPAGLVYSYTDVTTALPYTLTLNSAGANGNAANQNYTVAASIALGLSGNCATPGGSCTNNIAAATDRTRTVTITY
jgi:Spore Coat Protein U domain